MNYLTLLAFALATASDTVDIDGQWLNTGKNGVYFTLYQQGSKMSVVFPEMPPQIFAALGSMEIPGTIKSAGTDFEVKAHLERKGLSVYQGKDTCDVLFHIEFGGWAVRSPQRKTFLKIPTCSYHRKISCVSGTNIDSVHTCDGAWIPIDGGEGSCSANLP